MITLVRFQAAMSEEVAFDLRFLVSTVRAQDTHVALLEHIGARHAITAATMINHFFKIGRLKTPTVGTLVFVVI